MADKPLLPKLIARGDHVSIDRGRLRIDTASGKPVPPEWRQEHSDSLVTEILQSVGIEAYVYQKYSTGRYGPTMRPGLNLSLRSLIDGQAAYAIFNANLDRARGPKKGRPLRKGRFTVPKNGDFLRLWDSTDLTPARRLSAYWEIMHRLKGTIFCGDRHPTKSGRLVASTLSALTLSLTDSSLRSHQSLTNSLPKWLTNDSPVDHVEQGLEQISTTCPSDYDNKLIRKHVKSDIPLEVHRGITHLGKKSLQEQTIEEWYADYDAAIAICSPEWRALHDDTGENHEP